MRVDRTMDFLGDRASPEKIIDDYPGLTLEVVENAAAFTNRLLLEAERSLYRYGQVITVRCGSVSTAGRFSVKGCRRQKIVMLSELLDATIVLSSSSNVIMRDSSTSHSLRPQRNCLS